MLFSPQLVHGAFDYLLLFAAAPRLRLASRAECKCLDAQECFGSSHLTPKLTNDCIELVSATSTTKPLKRSVLKVTRLPAMRRKRASLRLEQSSKVILRPFLSQPRDHVATCARSSSTMSRSPPLWSSTTGPSWRRFFRGRPSSSWAGFLHTDDLWRAQRRRA